MEANYDKLKQLSNGKKDKMENIDSYIAQGQDKYEGICLGYLYIILTEADSPNLALRELIFLARDRVSFLISTLVTVICEFFEFLLDKPREQIFWLVNQLISLNASYTENIIVALLRQLACEPLSPLNMYLCKNLIGLLNANRDWLLKNHGLTCIAVYCFMRSIEDYTGPEYHPIVEMEIDFCSFILLNHFSICVKIGRDLIRILQLVGRHTRFSTIWGMISDNPMGLIPGVEGQESEGFPRWALVGYLISIVQKENIRANCKFSLFFDWLFTLKCEPLLHSIGI
ncbi:hypothetical protein MXB_2736 [Myxobolus squamalis]|nr:hypothetical protein MXB_2736 [Myxobolus squamalis]